MSRARGQMTREDAMAILNVEPMAGPDSLPDIVDLEKVRGVAFGDGYFGVDLGVFGVSLWRVVPREPASRDQQAAGVRV